MKARLPLRLFVSNALVALVAVAASYLTVRLLGPQLCDRQMGMMGEGNAMMGGHTPSGAHAAFASALDTALAIGVLAGIAAAGALAAFVTRQLVRPLDAVRTATRQIAAGRYEARVPPPSPPELAEMASDVNALADALAATETRRTRLLGDVAHEMRTPLTSLDGYVEGMIDGVFPADQKTLTSVSGELRRLHRLADDLSSLSRAEQRRLNLKPVQADLADLARRAADRLAPQFHDADVELVVDNPRAVAVHVDPDRVGQIITNLLGNALLATPAGGRVTVRVTGSEARAEVVVTDTGVGLEPEDTERVFERFYRAAGPARLSSGSGIGLTIARGIARAHGGDLTATSQGPGMGASFTLVLPSAGAASAASFGSGR